MQKHFRYAIIDALAYKQQTVVVGLYKVKYQTKDKKVTLELYDTDFHIGTLSFIESTEFIDVKLKITAKTWQINILKDIFHL